MVLKHNQQVQGTNVVRDYFSKNLQLRLQHSEVDYLSLLDYLEIMGDLRDKEIIDHCSCQVTEYKI